MDVSARFIPHLPTAALDLKESKFILNNIVRPALKLNEKIETCAHCDTHCRNKSTVGCWLAKLYVIVWVCSFSLCVLNWMCFEVFRRVLLYALWFLCLFFFAFFLIITPGSPQRSRRWAMGWPSSCTSIYMLYLKKKAKKIKNKKLPLRVENCSVFQRTNPVGPLFLFFFFIIFIFYFLEVQT